MFARFRVPVLLGVKPHTIRCNSVWPQMPAVLLWQGLVQCWERWFPANCPPQQPPNAKSLPRCDEIQSIFTQLHLAIPPVHRRQCRASRVGQCLYGLLGGRAWKPCCIKRESTLVLVIASSIFNFLGWRAHVVGSDQIQIWQGAGSLACFCRMLGWLARSTSQAYAPEQVWPMGSASDFFSMRLATC